ncbi:MAG: hypothetical protein AAF722_16290 [Cyanobacteria bacterium P01_C01_bin.70]
MFSLSNWSKYCLTAAALAGLSVTVSSLKTDLQYAQTQSQDPILHRGSGRAITPLPQSSKQELASNSSHLEADQSDVEQFLVVHRGSGRSLQDKQSTSTFYRGSGRVVPQPSRSSEWI